MDSDYKDGYVYSIFLSHFLPRLGANSYLPLFLSVWRAVAEFEVRRKGHGLHDSEGRPQGVVLHDVARKSG